MERMIPKQGELYKHFKNKLYKVVTIARDCETMEEMVVYQAMYGNNECYIRSVSDFMAELSKEQYPNATQKYRFEKVEEEAKVEEKPLSVIEPITAKEETIDDRLMKFLEADTYAEKLDCLIAIERKLDERILNNIAVSMDVVLPEGSLEDKFISLRNCVATQAKYECNRLR